VVGQVPQELKAKVAFATGQRRVVNREAASIVIHREARLLAGHRDVDRDLGWVGVGGGIARRLLRDPEQERLDIRSQLEVPPNIHASVYPTRRKGGQKVG